MINKNNLWFLTLFCLVIVLSIYYVTMPNNLLEETNTTTEEVAITETSQTDLLSALKLEDDNKSNEQIKEIKEKLSSSKTSSEDKNSAFEQLKLINKNITMEETIEDKIKSELSIDSFVKIEDDKVKVVVSNKDTDETLANNIMRLVNEMFDEKVYVTVSIGKEN